MGHQTHRPDLSNHELSPGDWSDDDTQGVDYELMFGGLYQYCFIEVERKPIELDFMAFGLTTEPKLRSHPDLHQRVVPTEIIDWLSGRIYARIEHGVDTCQRFTITGRDAEKIAESDTVDEDGEGEQRTTLAIDGSSEGSEQMTAFELVRAVAIGRIQHVR